MTSRRSKPRKTSDKMAVYKAAASKIRQTAGASRTSPRIMRKITTRSPTRSSPRNLSQSSREIEISGGGSSAQNRRNSSPKGFGSSRNLPQKVAELPQRIPSSAGSMRESHSNTQESVVENIYDEVVIPETPPREPASRNRKRVVAPAVGELSSEPDEYNKEGEKPTKKRKVFQTPPKGVDSAALQRDSDSLSARTVGSNGLRLDSLDSSLDVDEVVDPPLPPARIAKPISLSRKFDASRVFCGRRESIRTRLDGAQIKGGKGAQVRTTERSVSDAASLDMIATSSATLSRMFERFISKVSSEIEDFRMAHLSEIRKVGEDLKNHLASETRNIQGLVEMISNGSQTGSHMRSDGNVSLKEWERTLDSLTPYATLIFGKDLFSRILSFNVPFKAVHTYSKYSQSEISDVERASLSVQTMLFRLHRADKKLQYMDDVGKLHSDFKFSVVRNAFFNVGLDTFGIFKKEAGLREQAETGGIELKSKGLGKLSRPSWLAEGSVSLDHISQARAFTETPGQSRKEKIRRSPSPDDIGCHGALRVYRQLGKILHDGRGNLRVAFFQGLGYLLLPWKGRFADVDQRTMRIAFPEEDVSGEMSLSLRLEDVPSTVQCPQNADMKTVNMADAANKKLLRDMFGEWRSMVLAVDHDVIVTEGGHQKAAQSEKRRLHRLIHLIDVSLDCCVEFCRTGSREAFLRANKNSLKCVMIFALLFKAICLEFMDMSETNASSGTPNIPEPTDVNVYGTCLKDLIPGLTTQKSILSHKCLQLPVSLYDTLHHSSVNDDDVEENEERTGDVLDLRKIEESAEDGICPI